LCQYYNFKINKEEKEEEKNEEGNYSFETKQKIYRKLNLESNLKYKN
jgi:hypothetical protein